MEEWHKTTVATVPITVGGAELRVALDAGVRTQDIRYLGAGTASTDGEYVIFDGPPCLFTLSYRVLETGQHGRVGWRDGICRPRGHIAIGIAPPAL
jgi:hypothetical protein